MSEPIQFIRLRNDREFVPHSAVTRISFKTEPVYSRAKNEFGEMESKATSEQTVAHIDTVDGKHERIEGPAATQLEIYANAHKA